MYVIYVHNTFMLKSAIHTYVCVRNTKNLVYVLHTYMYICIKYSYIVMYVYTYTSQLIGHTCTILTNDLN